MLRLIGFLMMAAVGLGGFLALDYNMSRQWASAGDEDGLTIREYLGGLSGRIASITASSRTPGLPSALVDMLPKPPEGWTVRPAVPKDVDVFQPKNRADGDPEAIALVTSIGSAKVAKGADVAILTYEKGKQRVVVKAVRYPDFIFTSFTAMQQRLELQMMSPKFRGLSFMTVRGMDVTEDILPGGMRGRVFMADIGAQIHLWVLAPNRMKDPELVAFFQTLQVKAMNASVVDKRQGLGDVPVIVLASALDAAGREAYQADRAARAAEEVALREEDRKAAEAEAAAAAEANKDGSAGDDLASETENQPPGVVADCLTGVGGTKRCTVGD
ncbi:MAG: hypothetical protein C0524_04545 [Rhodobacter sp.]|nr:hypothetical protein [Rhodobacter sp.]